MSNIIRLMRPHQYIKNLFIFAPMLFSFQITFKNFTQSFVAFVLFSLLASSIYILNDYMDIEEDKKHPTKKFRPLASGEISKKIAIVLFLVLSISTLTIAFTVNINLMYVLFIYFVLNILYSIKLKHISLIDIFIIAIGFVLRLFAGSIMINVSLSRWIIIMTFLLALFLAVAKRRDDVLLSIQGKDTRKNIDGYNLELVNSMMIFLASIIVVSYIMYTVSIEVITKFHTKYLYLTAFFVILGVVRYMQITFVDGLSGSPTKIVLKDKFLQIVIVFWLISFVAIIKA